MPLIFTMLVFTLLVAVLGFVLGEYIAPKTEQLAQSRRAIALNEGKLMFDGPPNEIDDEKFQEIYGKEAERIG